MPLPAFGGGLLRLLEVRALEWRSTVWALLWATWFSDVGLLT